MNQTIYLAGIKVPSVANIRQHWGDRAKYTRNHRALGKLSVKGFPNLPCTVTLTRIAPRKLDGDNLQAAFKAFRDGVADGLGIKSDADPRVTWVYKQETGDVAVRVTIVEENQ